MLALGRLNAMHDDGATIGYDEIDASDVVAGVDCTIWVLLQAIDIDGDGFEANDDVEFDIFVEPMTKSALVAEQFMWFSSEFVAFNTANWRELPPSSRRRCKPEFLNKLALLDGWFLYRHKMNLFEFGYVDWLLLMWGTNDKESTQKKVKNNLYVFSDDYVRMKFLWWKDKCKKYLDFDEVDNRKRTSYKFMRWNIENSSLIYWENPVDKYLISTFLHVPWNAWPDYKHK